MSAATSGMLSLWPGLAAFPLHPGHGPKQLFGAVEGSSSSLQAASNEPQISGSLCKGCGSTWEQGHWTVAMAMVTQTLCGRVTQSPAVPGWMPGRGGTGAAQRLRQEHFCMLPSAVLTWCWAQFTK